MAQELFIALVTGFEAAGRPFILVETKWKDCKMWVSGFGSEKGSCVHVYCLSYALSHLERGNSMQLVQLGPSGPSLSSNHHSFLANSTIHICLMGVFLYKILNKAGVNKSSRKRIFLEFSIELEARSKISENIQEAQEATQVRPTTY